MLNVVIYYGFHYINWMQNYNKCSLLILPSLGLENDSRQLSFMDFSIISADVLRKADRQVLIMHRKEKHAFSLLLTWRDVISQYGSFISN